MLPIENSQKEVVAMTAQFEFHLRGADAPEGTLDADHLVSIVTSLREVATRIGRVETDAESTGRAPGRVQRVARLWIGLAPGSTTVLARRVGGGDGALEIDLADEQSFDERFQELVESIAEDRRPPWVGDSLSRAAEGLTGALQQAAPDVEFRVDGQSRRQFKTGNVHRETWRVVTTRPAEALTFVGRLYAVNLKTHRLEVQDDVGHQVALPRVSNDTEVARLIDSYVVVTGSPEHEANGRLTRMHDVTIEAAPDPLGGNDARRVVSLDEILASAPGLDLDSPGIGLTPEESESFWAVLAEM
jgi:hypothetical protein